MGTTPEVFVLYNQSADKWNIYNMDHASTRVSPNSTYKIYDALLGWNLELLHQNIPLSRWNGEPYPFHSWEADQDLTSAIHNSVNWYFQAIDSQAGFEAVRTFLQTINYGNQNTGNKSKSLLDRFLSEDITHRTGGIVTGFLSK